MNFKKIIFFTACILILFSINFVSATDLDVNNTVQVFDSNQLDNNQYGIADVNVNQKLLKSEINDGSMLFEGQLSENEAYVIYVGQNNTFGDGDGSKENPFTTLDLACQNLSDDKNNVTINIFNGSYNLGGDLNFNADNIVINGIGDVIIFNKDTTDSQSITLLSQSATICYNNITFNYNNYTLNPNAKFYPVVGESTNLAIFDNCTFILHPKAAFFKTGKATSYIFKNCKFIGENYNKVLITGTNTKKYSYSFDYCTFYLPNSDKALVTGFRFNENNSLIQNIMFNNCWFGKNDPSSFITVSTYLSNGKTGPKYELPLMRYAQFKVSENYLGNCLYELIGKLTWNGTDNQEGMENFQPMTVKLRSDTGNISSTATLVNGNFRTTYNSTNTNHKINYILDSINEDLEFTTVNITADSVSIFYGEDQNITVNFSHEITNNVTIVVSNATYNITDVVKVNGISFNYTIQDRLKAGTYNININLSEGSFLGAGTTTLTVSQVSDYIFEVVLPSEVKVGDNATITIILPSDVNGTVIVVFGNETPQILEANSTMTINYTNLNADTYPINVTYGGNDKYVSKNFIDSVTVNKADSSLDINDAVFTYGEVIAIPFNVTNAYGVTVSVSNKDGDEVATASSESNIIVLDMLPAGEYAVEVTTVVGTANYEWVAETINLTINKANSSLDITDKEFAYASEAVINAVTENSTGDVIAVLTYENNIEIAVTVSGDNITLPLLNVGKYTLTVTTNVDDNHNSVTKSATINVNRVDSSVDVSDVVLDYGDSVSVDVVFDGAVGVTAELDGDSIIFEGTSIPISGFDAGVYNLTVTTIPDDNHNAVSKTVTVTVNKVDSTLTVDDFEFAYGTVGSTVVLFTGASGVVAEVVNQSNAIVDVTGEVISVSDLDVGNYTLSVTTIADKNHNNVIKTATITVNKIDSSVDVSDVVLDYGDSVSVDVVFDGAVGVTAELDGDSIIFEGTSIPISGLDVGIYNLTVTTIPDDNHNAVSKTVTITVNKLASEITLASDEVTLNVNDEIVSGASLVPANGELTYVSSNESVATVVNGVIVAHAEGTAVITVRYVGNDNYAAAEDKTITVTVAEMFIEGYDVDMTYEDGSAYMVQLVDKYGNPVAQANEAINITIHGRSYIRLTNDSGIAKVTIHLNASSYEATAQYGKVVVNNMITVHKLPIIGYDVNMTYKDGSAYMVQLIDKDGNPFAKSNQAINITIAGRTYTRYTNADGIAKITINLAAGVYDVTAQYGNTVVNNVVTVNKLPIVASDVNMTYKDGSEYRVQLVDKNGNPFAKANEAINITIDGRTYTRYTNASGIAKVTINLRAGEYTVTAQYGDTIIENMVTVNNKFSISASDLVMNYKDGSTFEVQLLDQDGNPCALAKEPVKITVAGKTYTRSTDENGVARIVINLGAGTYPVITEYNNKTLNNTITVNKT